MSNIRVVGALNLALSVSVLSACGGGSSPALPAPVPTATPTPLPTPPPLALSVIPPCRLPSNVGVPYNCTRPRPRLGAEVNAAVDRVIAVRPDLVDFNDFIGGPRILNPDAFLIAVVAALGEAGLCAHTDAEGEVGVKYDNSFNEQWVVATRMGWGKPTGHYVERKFAAACVPSAF
jgi:hypothetical protein